MEQILLRALALVLVVVLGYVIKRIGWVRAGDFPIFAAIVLRITLPAALITSFNEFEVPLELLLLAGVGIAVDLIMSAAGYLAARSRGRSGQAFAVLNVGSFNIGAFATPYISGFMGPRSMLYASVFDIGNSLAAGGLAVGWAKHLAREDAAWSWRNFARDLLSSPIFVTYLGLLSMRLLSITLPAQVIAVTSLVGAANPFLAMLMIGIGLELRLDRAKVALAARLLGLRYGLAVVFALATWLLLPFPAEVRVVLCMLYFAPIAAMMAGFTQETGGDVEVATFMTSVSILVGIVVMPALLLTLG